MKIPKARKLSSGKWFIQLRLKQPDGTQQSISVTGDTEKQCTARAAEIKAGMKSPDPKIPSMTLGEACDAYIKEKQDIYHLSPSTIAGYKKLRKNTFQSCMDRKLSVITNDMLNLSANRMLSEGKTWKYVLNAVGLIRPAMRRYRPDFVMEITPPHNRTTKSRQKKIAKKLSLPTEDEIKAIVEACRGKEIELPILLALWLGMRMSEIRGLRYCDIHGSMMHICNVIVEDFEGNHVEKDTKTDAGDRWIDIPDYILSLIPKDGNPTDHIIKMSGRTIYNRYTKLLKESGIRHFRFHDLRCANAAVMINLGIDSKYAMEHNGWSTEHMYKQVYGYVMAQKLASESTKVTDYFTNLGKENANKNAK